MKAKDLSSFATSSLLVCAGPTMGKSHLLSQLGGTGLCSTLDSDTMFPALGLPKMSALRKIASDADAEPAFTQALNRSFGYGLRAILSRLAVQGRAPVPPSAEGFLTFVACTNLWGAEMFPFLVDAAREIAVDPSSLNLVFVDGGLPLWERRYFRRDPEEMHVLSQDRNSPAIDPREAQKWVAGVFEACHRRPASHDSAAIQELVLVNGPRTHKSLKASGAEWTGRTIRGRQLWVSSEWHDVGGQPRSSYVYSLLLKGYESAEVERDGYVWSDGSPKGVIYHNWVSRSCPSARLFLSDLVFQGRPSPLLGFSVAAYARQQINQALGRAEGSDGRKA